MPTQQRQSMSFPGSDDEAKHFTLLRELWLFLRATGKWWLVPVLLTLILLGLAMLLSASSYAPFLYTLF
jgi:hypothetical protein